MVEDSSLLLEEIAKKADCRFLSDMHQAGKRQAILKAVGQIPDGVYTSQCWKDAALYITGNQCTESGEEEIRRCLEEFCKEA